jgi:hypothetical protein
MSHQAVRSCLLYKTVGRMDAAVERTWMYLQRVLHSKQDLTA